MFFACREQRAGLEKWVGGLTAIGPMAKSKPDELKIVCTNRKARYDYEIIDVVEAGLMLRGTEVKSLREGRASLVGAYGRLDGGEAWLRGAEIQEYSYGNLQNHDPSRARKLLLKKVELRKLEDQLRERGMAFVPLRIFFRGPYAKVELAVARGKKAHDKRHAMAKRDADREAARAQGRRY